LLLLCRRIPVSLLRLLLGWRARRRLLRTDRFALLADALAPAHAAGGVRVDRN
jgi:hypothetical protein